MIEVAVERILSRRDFGTLFSGLGSDGRRAIVSTTEPVFPVVGEAYAVEGEAQRWRDARGFDHRRIAATRLVRVRPSGRLLTPWLKGLPGVGEQRAKRLLDRWGTDLLDALGDPSQRSEIARVLDPSRPLLAMKLAALVQASHLERRAEEKIGIADGEFLAQLEQHGVEDAFAARRLWRLIGSADAWVRLSGRPYAVSTVLPWKLADHLGQRLLAPAAGARAVLGHPDRLAGACDSVVRDLLAEGHTAASPEEVERRLERKGVPPARALATGLERGKLLPFNSFLRAPGAARVEAALHRHLERLRAADGPYDAGADLRALELVRRAERAAGLRLTEEQRLAVGVLLRGHVALLQGGAGVGKTTIVKVLVAVWRAVGGRVEMAALSGKAALRLSKSVGEKATTIARLASGLDRRAELVEAGKLVEAPEGDRWAKGPARAADGERHDGDDARAAFPPKLDAETMLILDEASMVDLGSLHDLARRLPDGARLVLIGDRCQLPPIGLGQCFHDLVGAGRGVAELTRVLRQAEGNPLLDAALAIREGREPELPRFAGVAAGAHLADCPPHAVAECLRAVRDRLLRESPGDEVLVVAGLRATVAGVNRAEMARRQSQGAEGVRLGPLCPWISVGDPVIMCRNHYRFGLMNGETGVVTGIDPAGIAWGPEGRSMPVEDDYRADIQPAWAITGHRSQGSEAARVVVALDSKAMLTRQWLYTAVTRAAQQTVLVGPRALLGAAVGRVSERVTGFSLLAGGASANED